MFVRINTEDGRERIVECEAVTFNPDEGRDDDKDVMIVHLTLNGASGIHGLAMDFAVEKKGVNAVYVMNNQGKTIDTYRW